MRPTWGLFLKGENMEDERDDGLGLFRGVLSALALLTLFVLGPILYFWLGD